MENSSFTSLLFCSFLVFSRIFLYLLVSSFPLFLFLILYFQNLVFSRSFLSFFLDVFYFLSFFPPTNSNVPFPPTSLLFYALQAAESFVYCAVLLVVYCLLLALATHLYLPRYLPTTYLYIHYIHIHRNLHTNHPLSASLRCCVGGRYHACMPMDRSSQEIDLCLIKPMPPTPPHPLLTPLTTLLTTHY